MKFILFALLWLLACAVPPVSSKALYIGIDESYSNPVATDEASAKVAGLHVKKKIAALDYGDFVHIRTFGDRSAAHVMSRTFRIDRKHKPEDVAALIESHIKSLPSKPRKGAGETQILAFLEFGQFECRQGTIVLLSDGIESSPSMKQKDLLQGKPLPAPEPDILSGCTVEIFPFGSSVDGSIPTSAVKAMRKSWAAWMKAAGAVFIPITSP